MIENVTVSVTENGELENMDSRVGTQVGRSLSAVKVTKNPVSRPEFSVSRPETTVSRLTSPTGRLGKVGVKSVKSLALLCAASEIVVSLRKQIRCMKPLLGNPDTVRPQNHSPVRAFTIVMNQTVIVL